MFTRRIQRWGVFSLSLFLGTCLWSRPANGVPAYPDAVTVRQPDGESLRVFLRGDEHAHWYEDSEGYAVALSGETGQWVYAMEVDGRILPTNHVVGEADPKAIGLVKPDTGRITSKSRDRRLAQLDATLPIPRQAASQTYKNLVVLVNFTDKTITNTPADFDALFNTIGYSVDGAVGSVKDYYLEVSYGTALVESTVVAAVTLDHGYAYYGANDQYSNDIRPREMVAEALAKLEARGFDFRTVDGDGNGWVDGLTIIHAGGGEEYGGNDANYIWSHMGIFGWVTYDGVSMALYHTEPARRGWDSSPSTWGITRIGVICHEMGHFFGLPDLYDYGGDSRGAGNFCLMAHGSWNGNAGTMPAHMSAWCKARLLLISPTVISAAGTYTLNQVETVPQLYKLQGPLPENEYFLIENRRGTGFDAGLPGSSRGILIWHIDESQADNDDQTHYMVDLEEAGGPQHLQLNQNAGQDSDYFRLGNATSFTDRTTPSNLSYSGTPVGMNIMNVGASGPIRSFDASLPCRLTLSVINGAWGHVEIAPPPFDANSPEYPAGTLVTLTAVPEPNKLFREWEIYDPNHPGDANHAIVDANSSTTVLMNTDREVSAAFKCGGGIVPVPAAMIPLGLGVFLLRRRSLSLLRTGSDRSNMPRTWRRDTGYALGLRGRGRGPEG